MLKMQSQLLNAHYSLYNEAKEFNGKIGVCAIPVCALYSIKYGIGSNCP